MPITIYGLIDPTSRMLRYVGQTSRLPGKRLKQHLRTCQERTTPPVNAWLRGLQNAGKAPELIELETQPTAKQGHEAEEFWIGLARSWGFDLLNILDGGLQRSGWHHSPTTCAEMSKRHKGKFYAHLYTENVRARMAASLRETWKRTKHPRLGKRHTAETKIKIAANRALNPPKLTDEGRANLAAARYRRWYISYNSKDQLRFDF